VPRKDKKAGRKFVGTVCTVGWLSECRERAFGELFERASLPVVAAGVAIGYATVSLAQAVTGALIVSTIAAIFGVSRFDFETDSFTVLGIEVAYGSLISNAIVFVLVLIVAYFIVVAPHRWRLGGTEGPIRSCPECTSSIPAAARRCPCCTAVVQPKSA